jgi:Domain of unknown function (DUF4326)
MMNDLDIRVLNKKHITKAVANSVYIGRPSIWGNPFVIGKDGTRDQVIEKYAAWIVQQRDLMARLHELRGKNLVCWCAPCACHGDVLMRLANGRRE